MSAFVVGDETINRVVGWLNNSDRQFVLRDILKMAEINPSDEEWREKLGASMFQMNCDAVNARYGEGQAGEFRPLDYKWGWENSSDVQVLKSLQCWLYQCSEGDIPERPLYREFRDLERIIACKIVDRLPEYSKAEW